VLGDLVCQSVRACKETPRKKEKESAKNPTEATLHFHGLTIRERGNQAQSQPRRTPTMQITRTIVGEATAPDASARHER
jgi:hypothetical protein